MVEGIDADVVSDMSTNIIREHLITYTQERCRYYGIPMQVGVNSGRLWNRERSEWTSRFVDLPVPDHGPLILVPKAIVRRKLEFDPGEYYQHYILEQLEAEEIRAGTELVRLLRDGRRKVFKKDLVTKYGRSKKVSAAVTLRDASVLERYRGDKRAEPAPPLAHGALLAVEEAPDYDWDAALNGVLSIAAGQYGADAYVDAIQKLSEALFYPALVSPEKEVRIHDGRKRIDLVFSNMAEGTFFKWLAAHHRAASIVVECKNYEGDPANPELDQLAGRFSSDRGQVGFLVCRTLGNRGLFEQRCADTAHDGRGFIVVLDDSDLTEMVRLRKEGDDEGFDRLLRRKFDRLIR